MPSLRRAGQRARVPIVSTYEEMKEDGRVDAAREEPERHMPDTRCYNCRHEGTDWRLVDHDSHHGADADGNRGWHLYEWECPKCGTYTTTEEG